MKTIDELRQWLRNAIAERERWQRMSYNVNDSLWIRWAEQWLRDIEAGRWPPKPYDVRMPPL